MQKFSCIAQHNKKGMWCGGAYLVACLLACVLANQLADHAGLGGGREGQEEEEEEEGDDDPRALHGVCRSRFS